MPQDDLQNDYFTSVFNLSGQLCRGSRQSSIRTNLSKFKPRRGVGVETSGTTKDGRGGWGHVVLGTCEQGHPGPGEVGCIEANADWNLSGKQI